MAALTRSGTDTLAAVHTSPVKTPTTTASQRGRSTSPIGPPPARRPPPGPPCPGGRDPTGGGGGGGGGCAGGVWGRAGRASRPPPPVWEQKGLRGGAPPADTRVQ